MSNVVSILLSAILFTVSFPPLHLRGLAWIALVPLFVTIRRLSPRRAIVAAMVWGMLAAYGTTDWLPPTLANYYHQPFWLGLSVFLTAAFFMGAAEYAGFAAAYRIAASSGSRPRVVFCAAAWALAEYGRDHLLTGNPWGLIGYSQLPIDAADATAFVWLAKRIVQVADLGGVYLVSFLIVAVNAALAELVLVRPGRAEADASDIKGASSAPESWLKRELAVAAILVLAATIYGSAMLRQSRTDGDVGVEVAIVQPNLDLGSQWNPALYGRNLDVLLSMTNRELSARPASLVIWPENAMTFFVGEEPAYRAVIRRTLAKHGAALLAGGPERSNSEPIRYFNSAFVFDSEATILGRYDKQHLLPFAEYFPVSGANLLRRAFGRVREFSPGAAAELLPTAVGRAGVLICNEAMFPWLARDRVRAGAEVLVNLSNDSWVASTEFAEDQLGIASMRAIEQRRWMIRASTSGPSAFVDLAGIARASTTSMTAATLHGTVAAKTEESVYARIGDSFIAVCAALTILSLLRFCGLTSARSGSGPL